jgi:UDP-N-acetylmuramoyl-tripeptide--D-alanyl-D-alanine ligase
VQRRPGASPEGVAVYLVRDTLAALQRLAADRRRGYDVRVIGVTGSVGKTTTKEIIASVLKSRFHVLKNEANYNNEIGLPLTLLGLSKRHERAVLEMGMYALGEIRQLCEIALPHVGVVTNVGPSHLERLGSMDMATAKAEPIESLPSDGTPCSTATTLVRVWLQNQVRTLLFGTAEVCRVRGADVESDRLMGIAFVLEYEGKRTPRALLPGRHSPTTPAAAALTGRGMSLEEVADAIEGAGKAATHVSKAAMVDNHR